MTFGGEAKPASPLEADRAGAGPGDDGWGPHPAKPPTAAAAQTLTKEPRRVVAHPSPLAQSLMVCYIDTNRAAHKPHEDPGAQREAVSIIMNDERAPAGEGPRRFSVCLFCGSSNAADPAFLDAAAEFGRMLASEGVRLVYGGGGIGLMGAAAKACHGAGGEVLGIMPDFLRRREVVYDDVETVIVTNMHDRKRIMFEQSDAFAIFPGGVGTLEEVVELMSWRRLDLHRKPIVFLNMKGFWEPLYALLAHTAEQKVSPAWLPDTWGSVATVAEVLPACRAMIADAAKGPGFFGYEMQNAEVVAKA